MILFGKSLTTGKFPDGYKPQFGEQMNMFQEGQTKQNEQGERLVYAKNKAGRLDWIKESEAQAVNQEGKKEQHNPEQTQQAKPEPPLKKIESAVDEARQRELMEKYTRWSRIADEYIYHASGQKDMFLSDMDMVALANGLERPSVKYAPFAVKDKKSILNKLERNEAKGKLNAPLTDILRTTIVIKSPAQLNELKGAIEKNGYEIVETDNLYEDKKPGYKHIALKLKKGDSDKVTKELLLMRPNMLDAKFGLGHDMYDVMKNVINVAPKVQEIKSAFEAAQKFDRSLKRISDKYYEVAYNRDLEDDSASLALSTTPAIPTNDNKNSSRKSSGSRTEDKRFIFSLRSSLKQIWQPILAELRNSSGDMASREALAAAIDEISASIIQPTKNTVDKYLYGQGSLFKSNITSCRTRFNKGMGANLQKGAVRLFGLKIGNRNL
ncbi:MAG TPA: hypothetical protein VHO03_16935 [Ignavibacteriales bacterium]|nr:hypothetical protein [Ignavibacteriales bacterium]